MSELEQQPVNEQKKRPKFLLVLCILTFISTGFEFLGSLLKLVSGPLNNDQMQSQLVSFQEGIDKMKEIGADSFVDSMQTSIRMFKQVNENHYLAAFISIIVCVLGAYAALRMFKGYRLGFHLYIIYSILSFVSIYAYVSIGNVPTNYVLFGSAISLVFILLYSRNLKWMQ
jgi:hypothetical protein